MSIKKALAQKQPQTGDLCRTCRGTRFITTAGTDYAIALRCPDCFTHCAHCNDVGSLLTPNAFGSWDTTPCPLCKPVTHRIQLFNQARIPRRYRDADLNRIRTDHDASIRKAVLYLGTWLKEWTPGAPGILLSGPVGTGKTLMMAAILRSLTLQRGIGARFVEFTHLLAEIKAGFDDGQSGSEIINHLVDVPVLCIDELGKGLRTEWQLAILDELISKRYNRSVTTLFTTNFPLTQPTTISTRAGSDDWKIASIEDQIGSRMYSRIHEMSQMLSLTAPDFRRLADKDAHGTNPRQAQPTLPNQRTRR